MTAGTGNESVVVDVMGVAVGEADLETQLACLNQVLPVVISFDKERFDLSSEVLTKVHQTSRYCTCNVENEVFFHSSFSFDDFAIYLIY